MHIDIVNREKLMIQLLYFDETSQGQNILKIGTYADELFTIRSIQKEDEFSFHDNFNMY